MYKIDIVTNELPVGKIGDAYRVSLEAETFPETDQIEWSCKDKLPYGLEFDFHTGILSGITTVSFLGTITIWAKRTDFDLSCYKRFLLNIKEGEKPAKELHITGIAHSTLEFGTNCSIQLKAEGGIPPYKWKIENLPIGMKLDSGVINGIPAMGGGSFPLEISIEDMAGNTDSYFCWLIIE